MEGYGTAPSPLSFPIIAVTVSHLIISLLDLRTWHWESKSKSSLNLSLHTYHALFSLCRVQQIQLLGRDMKGPAHDKLWNQLEAEIHLHRHKTVIRACRGRNDLKRPMQVPPGHVSFLFSTFVNIMFVPLNVCRHWIY